MLMPQVQFEHPLWVSTLKTFCDEKRGCCDWKFSPFCHYNCKGKMLFCFSPNYRMHALKYRWPLEWDSKQHPISFARQDHRSLGADVSVKFCILSVKLCTLPTDFRKLQLSFNAYIQLQLKSKFPFQKLTFLLYSLFIWRNVGQRMFKEYGVNQIRSKYYDILRYHDIQ